MALLSLQQIHKTFEKGTVNENHVLRGLDLDIEQGDFISVIGGNGAGKSTLMNSIAGVLSIDEGDILKKIWRLPIVEVKNVASLKSLLLRANVKCSRKP